MPNRRDLPNNITKILAAHVAHYKEDPIAAHMWDARQIGERDIAVVPTLLLTTTGRKSGEQRYATLAYLKDGDNFLIVGSKGGLDVHPSWVHNLIAMPECHIQVADFGTNAIARELKGEERERAWQLLIKPYPNYARYQTYTDRLIPVFLLEPAESDQRV